MIKEKHIERLTKGKKSGIKIGSRAVPHRLTKYEQAAFSRARKYGFLVVESHQRGNVETVWGEFCAAKNIACYVLIKQGEKAKIMRNEKSIYEGSLAEAKAAMKTIMKDQKS